MPTNLLFRYVLRRAFMQKAYLVVLWFSFWTIILSFSGESSSVWSEDGAQADHLLHKQTITKNGTQAEHLLHEETATKNGTQANHLLHEKNTTEGDIQAENLLNDQNMTAKVKLNHLNLGPLEDKATTISEKELADEIQSEVHNLPIAFWLKHKNQKLSKNKMCAKFPSPYEISYNNVFWQTLKTSNGTFYLYNAYYDNRTLIAKTPVVRLIGMIDRIEPKITYCQLWFSSRKEPLFAEVWEYKYIWHKSFGNYKNGLLQPYLISCYVPPGYRHLVPESVSLVEKPCDMATTSLRVINDRPSSGKKEDFAVCVKGLDFLHNDLSVRMVEWLELLSLLGAHKVFLYNLEVHPNVTKVLDYYKKRGLIDVTKLTLPGEQPNILNLRHMYLKAKVTNKRQNEVIPYNDCLYRNIYRYNYVILLDTDEIIMPKSTISWKTLMGKVITQAKEKRNDGYSSYNVRNVYFMDSMLHLHGWNPDIPRYMHMSQHVYRSENYTKPGAYIKCFHDTERVKTLHNHFPFSCISKACTSFSIDTSDAQLNHYRPNCVSELKKVCISLYQNHTTLDTTILKYQKPLVARVTDTLSRLGFFGKRTTE